MRIANRGSSYLTPRSIVTFLIRSIVTFLIADVGLGLRVIELT